MSLNLGAPSALRYSSGWGLICCQPVASAIHSSSQIERFSGAGGRFYELFGCSSALLNCSVFEDKLFIILDLILTFVSNALDLLTIGCSTIHIREFQVRDSVEFTEASQVGGLKYVGNMSPKYILFVLVHIRMNVLCVVMSTV